MVASPRPTSAHMIDPMRASTGTMPLSASHGDPYEPRHAHSGHPSNPYDPRSNPSQQLEVQPVSTTYRSPDQSTKRTEYTIRSRPRQRSSTISSMPSAADGHLRLTVPPAGSIRPSPVISSNYSGSPGPWMGDDSYMVPSSSSRYAGRGDGRTYNVDHARDTRRRGHPEYQVKPSSRRRYPAAGGFRKGEDIDQYNAYSYTNPEEQFARESLDRLHRSRGAYPRGRPLSMTGVDDPYSDWVPKKESRALGPPPSQRGFGKLERVQRSAHGSEDSREPTGSQKLLWNRGPVSLHQDWDDGYYSSHRDGYYDDSNQHHGRSRKAHRDENEARRSRKHNHTDSAPGPVAESRTGLGTAVLASGYGDSSHDLPSSDWVNHPVAYGHDYRGHPSRPRRPSRRRTRTHAEAYTSDEDRDYRQELSSGKEHQLAVEAPRRRRGSRSRVRVDDYQNGSGSSQEDLYKRSTRTNSPRDPELPPKGILKTPREKFPEEPNPVREGVAPLKDAHKTGIPPEARWTKIDRRIVNPAALEAGNERYEERSEYVIVLRVLTKEEIENYAIQTQEIRDARYKEDRRNRRRRRDEDRRLGRRTGESSIDDSDDEGENEEPLALEAPPPGKSSQATAEPAR